MQPKPNTEAEEQKKLNHFLEVSKKLGEQEEEKLNKLIWHPGGSGRR